RGRAAYPAVWHWGGSQAKIAMELVRVSYGLQCPRLLRWLHTWSADLRRTFPIRNKEGLAGLLCWYRLRGPLELDAAPPLPKSCIAITERPIGTRSRSAGDTCAPRIAIALASCLPNSSRSIAAGRQVIANWYRQYGQNFFPAPISRQVPAVV